MHLPRIAPRLAQAALLGLALTLIPVETRAQSHAGHGHDEETAAGGQSLRAEPVEVDFGEAYQGEILWMDVTFTNDGDEGFPISGVQTSCGCTAATLIGPGGAEYPTKTGGTEPILVVEPGSKVTVKVKFDTTNKHGSVQQNMVVHSSDPTRGKVEVPVRVRVTQALKIAEPWVNLGQIGKSERIERVAILESVEIGEWSVAGFANAVDGQELPSWLHLEPIDKTGARRQVKVVVDGPRPVGPISARVNILIDHARIDAVNLTITGIVKPNVVFETGDTGATGNINFEQIGPDEKVTRTIIARNTDPAIPYKLESVDVLSPQKDNFETTVRTIEEGMLYEVDITVDGAIGAPFFRGSLVLRAPEHPDLASHMIPFHGWVRK